MLPEEFDDGQSPCLACQLQRYQPVFVSDFMLCHRGTEKQSDALCMTNGLRSSSCQMQRCVPSSPFQDSFEAFWRGNGLEEDMETLGLTKEGGMMNQGPLLIVIDSGE